MNIHRSVKLNLPLKRFEELYSVANGRGKGCQINRADLMGLLMDHTRALAKLNELKVPLEDNYANSSQIRKAFAAQQ